MMFKRQIKNFRKIFEKVALRDISRYNVLTYLENLENVVPFVLKYILLNFHNYSSNYLWRINTKRKNNKKNFHLQFA